MGDDQAIAQLRRRVTMPEVPGPGLWFLSCFLLACVGTWWARAYALRRGLLDVPGDRRSHETATPRGGGIAIVAVVLLAMLVLAAAAPEQVAVLAAAACGLALVAAVGWLDDHRPVPAAARLLVHIAAGGLVGIGQWWTGQGPEVVLLAVIAVPVLVNVWNFMDGIDGLAASQAAIAAAAFAVIAGEAWNVGLAWAVVAACCGFLPFNFPRARIFLGDVGSGALGFLLAVLLVAQAKPGGEPAGAWLLMALPLATFLVDASLTLARRILRRERWWTPHVQHAYQRLACETGAHWPVTAGYGVWSIAGSVLLLTQSGKGMGVNLAVPATWLLVTGMAWFALQGAITARRDRHGSRS
jgi:UDP-N-acetylmuramyl pentapeptide phosphotransferase/UDP-N-acetylglucosamine-1-phosphate transferase